MISYKLKNNAGYARLSGSVKISGAKNSAIPIIISTLLVDGKTILKNIPKVGDIETTISLIKQFSSEVEWTSNNELTIHTNPISKNMMAEHCNLRFSLLALGIAFAKGINLEIPMPGGCTIGDRPIDIHLDILKKLGARIDCRNGMIKIRNNVGNVMINNDEPTISEIVLKLPSVGATINTILAVCCRPKTLTIISNAAKEPEVKDFCDFLKICGANIQGAGTDKIRIIGVAKLNGTSFEIIDDRIEASSFLISALVTKSKFNIGYKNPEHIKALIDLITGCGAKIDINLNSSEIKVDGVNGNIGMKSFNAATDFYPGLPTDVQSLLIPLGLCIGNCSITERIYENRIWNVPELTKMGAKIDVIGNKNHKLVLHKSVLIGSSVKANDIRSGMSLIIASLAAKGETTIINAEQIERGYEKCIEKFNKLGAHIIKV